LPEKLRFSGTLHLLRIRGETFWLRLHPMGGATMKLSIVLLFSIGMLSLANGQEKPPASDAVAAAVGLEIGQRAPAFALQDQSGHEQSNATLKGSKGLVILFFRSADW
jgi:cytochrome oxidase Cu insertion factor (SCO1/SenC/PrrC family)